MSEQDFETTVVTHYTKPEVQEEIVRYSKNRWVAVHCETVNPQGYQVLLRYRRTEGKTKQPLAITGGSEILLILNQFKQLRPRTFYASACTYRELVKTDNIRDVSNIESCTPTWDIDNAPDKWKATIETAKTIVEFLRQEGVSRSVFLKWSGKGLHVHVHQDAVSQTVLQRISPLDAAYAIVEHTNRSLRGLYAEIAEKHDAKELTVENEMDIQRVFTCPLSLHRNLNVVVVCFRQLQLRILTPTGQDLTATDTGETGINLSPAKLTPSSRKPTWQQEGTR